MKVAIVQTGGANLFSLQSALMRLGITAPITMDPEQILAATHVFLPGVGAAGHCMEHLRQTKLDKVLINLTQPVMGICLGMQIMCDTLEEDDTIGLGIFSHAVQRLQNAPLVPHMGWNRIKAIPCPLFKQVEEQDFYFVHSFALKGDDNALATCDYGVSFTVAVQHRNFYGVQFHPEKSGKAGEVLLRNFLGLKI